MNFVKSFLTRFISKLKMTQQEEEIMKRILPPSSVKGMKDLDKSAFKRDLVVPALAIPLKSIKKTIKNPIIKNKLLKLPCYRLNTLPQEVENGDGEVQKCKLYLLQPGSKFTEDERQEFIKSAGIFPKIIDQNITLGYENYSHQDVLKVILADQEDAVRGFSQIGHIIHINLRESLAPFKSIIGQVLLDKQPKVRTVVNKPGIIDTEFRHFQVELIAGENDFIATVGEHNCKFQFDFSKVFWNSRLSTEHTRIAEMMSQDDVIFDMFAGVGPFAVPLARKGCEVFANDLNPDSFKWLKKNAALNKTMYEAYNLDGNEFVKKALLPFLISRSKQKSSSDGKPTIHVLMNLPKTAIEFLPVFSNLITRDVINKEEVTVEKIPAISVHVYNFEHEESTKEYLHELVEKNLQRKLENGISVHYVRNVAPQKGMFCLTATLDHTILCEPLPLDDAVEQPEAKRAKIA